MKKDKLHTERYQGRRMFVAAPTRQVARRIKPDWTCVLIKHGEGYVAFEKISDAMTFRYHQRALSRLERKGNK